MQTLRRAHREAAPTGREGVGSRGAAPSGSELIAVTALVGLMDAQEARGEARRSRTFESVTGSSSSKMRSRPARWKAAS